MENMKTRSVSPELTASIFSLCTWQWLQPFVKLGNSKTLEAEDLYDMNPKEGTQHCEQLWTHALENVKQDSPAHVNSSLSVWKVFWYCFGAEYGRAALVKPIWLVAVILQVYILRALVNIVVDDKVKWWWATLLVIGIFSMSTLVSICQHMCFTLSQKVGMKLRSTVSMAVFNKLLNTKIVSLVGANSGLMLNLVTNDTQKLLDAATYFHFAWFAFIELGTLSTLAIIEIGVSAIPGVVVAFLTQPIQAWMAKVATKLRRKAVTYTDARVHLTGEVLNGIRVIKYNGWIAPFLQRIADLRGEEVYRIKRASFVRASTSTIRDSVTPLASLATFGTYLAIHNGRFMPPSQAFTVLALFSVLVRTFSLAPLGLQVAGEATVAIRCLHNLLDLAKVSDSSTMDNDISRECPDKAVVVMNCSFSWQQKVKKTSTSDMFKGGSGRVHVEVKMPTETEDGNLELPVQDESLTEDVTLKNINFSVNRGELVTIYGPVGSGKSSLLLAILGEMQCLKGKFHVQRNVAYVPQQPWILNDTVLRNIVFMSPFDPERYQRTISACALDQDITQFAGGYDTEIGDRGINLSGGQKARISLARACYSSAPVVLLDDPLAAVDVTTAKHLIERVLSDMLKGRTVILVTHNKTALVVCDRVFKMENGCLFEQEEPWRNEGSSTPTVSFDDTLVSDVKTDFDNSTSREEGYQKITFSDRSEKFQTEAPNNAVNDNIKGQSTIKEDRVQGNIKLSTWVAYGKASGGLTFFLFVILVFIIGQAVRVMVDYWLRVWTDREYHLRQEMYLVGYVSFIACATMLSLARALLFTYATIITAINMHGQMVERVLRSPQLFFDQNVTGRILNRFSKDQALVDEILPNTAQQMFEFAISSLGSLIFIGVLLPWFLLAFPPLFFIFFYVQRRYVVISRELKRLEALSRSPMYTHFTQILQGISSVRAYGTQSDMHKIFMALIDANHQSYILFVHMSRWLGIRLDFTTAMCVTLVSVLVILLRHSISPGLAGVILVQSIQVSGFTQFAVRQAAETENYLTSVERIEAYTQLPTEADPNTRSGVIGKDWPTRGEIEFAKYTMTYRVELPPVLNEISFKVNPQEKIGILGRTGAGKSSLAAALFRMVENEKCTGDILIDGVNIKHVGLDDLRQRLSIIPQV